MKIRKRNCICTLLLLGSMSALVCLPAEGSEVVSIQDLLMPTGDMAIREPSAPMELLSGSDAQELNEKMAAYNASSASALLINNAVEFYYYNNLDPVAKEIYDVMYMVAQDPVSEGNIGLIMTDMDPQSDEYYYEFNLANRAICFDHPELFWLYSGEEASMGYSSEAVNMGGFYFVYIKMIEPFLHFQEQMTKFNAAAQAFLKDINMVAPEYQIIRQVHDKLIDLVNYNDPAADEIRVKKGQNLAHTAYGALVEDSDGNPNYAVCDGYTLAFEYLLQQCGIEAVFLGGLAGSSRENAGGHAWNVVKMDGVWYEVDSTWDDSGSMLDDLAPGTTQYNYLTEALSDPGYRELIDHYLFLVSTDEISHFIPGEELKYITKDQLYVYTLCGESVHIRLTNDGTMTQYGPDPDVISLAPKAMQSYK